MTIGIKIFLTFLVSGISFAVMMYLQNKKEEKAEREFQMKMRILESKYGDKDV